MIVASIITKKTKRTHTLQIVAQIKRKPQNNWFAILHSTHFGKYQAMQTIANLDQDKPSNKCT